MDEFGFLSSIMLAFQTAKTPRRRRRGVFENSVSFD
jgi:hypothetical protein